MSFAPAILDWAERTGERWAGLFIKTGQHDHDAYFETMLACGGPILQQLREDVRRGFDGRLSEIRGGAK